jgi:hypothetical protein
MIFTAFILAALLVSLLSGAIWCLGYALGWWPRKLRVLRPDWRYGHPEFFRPLDTWPKD